MKIIGIFLMSIFLSSCVGVTVGTFGKAEEKNDSFSVRPEFGWSTDFNNKKYNQNETAGIWGEPDKTYTVGECEVFSYEVGSIWSGVWAYILVFPVPVGLPTEKKNYKMYFKNDESIALVAEKTEETYIFGYMCGELSCGFLAGNVYPFTGLEKGYGNTDVEQCEEP